MIIYTDQVLSEIGSYIGVREPETGGALLGIPFTNVICRFLPDPRADVTGSTYTPSATLQEIVRERERRDGLQFFGIVHSHPGYFDQPSSQDHIAFQNSLDVNPHLAQFIGPIVTLDRPADEANHSEISLPTQGRLTSYVAYRPKRTPEPRPTDWYLRRHNLFKAAEHAIVRQMDCSVMPLEASVETVVHELKTRSIEVKRNRGFLSVGGLLFQTETISSSSFDLILMFPPTYPFSKPIALLTSLNHGNPDTEEVPFQWRFLASGCFNLWKAIGEALLSATNHVKPNPTKQDQNAFTELGDDPRSK
ncbi:Mov34/MPN/PAD-1 family protein [Bradyrhizobium diazoefficiens]|uniref:Mov34/MPN/PAD-1 family protein n=1 Tax=Bradyrhizobium diazoefficiens TaxID=1355477 RepID=UPI00190A9B83|nr:Mov34/MPN/PAD-1 family protein [Bradyrhizobium diazoefficiens]QQO34252.1 Mov34/MPN/PAD-1 family protein [Bradyrhizobium diazoefficiens]